MHRATYIAVVNDRLELAIHQRAATKDLWPSYWDLAAGGVLGIDETPQDGAVRELAEELGITAPLAHLGTALYEDTDVSVLGDIFLARHNGPFDYVDGEVQRAEWISLDDLRVALPTRSFCPDSVELVLPRVCSAIED
jgi:8-oxo-dGTP pyrophosphatase MutT (NUDIX family)